MKRFTVFIAFLLLATASTSHAAFEAKSYSFSPTIGFYQFDHHQELKTSALVGLRISRYLTSHWAIEGVVQYVPTESKLKTGSDNEVSGLLYHIDSLYHFPVSEKWHPFLATGVGMITLDGNITGADTNLMLNYGGGIKYIYSDQVTLRTDIRQVLVDDNSTEHNMVYTVGLEFSWGRGKSRAHVKSDAVPVSPAPPVSAGAPALGDSDKDGVPDTHDLCPNTPIGVVADQEGCPVDSDGDGTPDHLDKCPDTPRGLITDKDGCALDTDRDGVPDSRDFCADTPPGVAVDKKGCPLNQDSDGDGVPDSRDVCPDTPSGVAVDKDGCAKKMDSDGDGVFDGQDKCPDTPSNTAVDENGCPKDSDGDGVPDRLDFCPGTPSGVAVDKDGCPLKMDRDGDGVFDKQDKCPGTPANTAVDKNGCPEVIKQKTVTESHIRFETGKSKIRAAFMGEVERIADYLKKFPETSIKIEGHTDNTGPEQLNTRLSLERAESLKEMLVTRFRVKASRLLTKGYSFNRPIADNNTLAGREKNRRVVVILTPVTE